jgi:hypothetical protein
VALWGSYYERPKSVVLGRRKTGDPAVIFADMLQRLESDPLWAREYEDFVSFAGPDEMIGFVDALASCRRRLAGAAGTVSR